MYYPMWLMGTDCPIASATMNSFQYFVCVSVCQWVFYIFNFASLGGFNNVFVSIRCGQGRSRCRSMDLPAVILI